MSKKFNLLFLISILFCFIKESLSLHFDFTKAKERCLIEEFFSNTVPIINNINKIRNN